MPSSTPTAESAAALARRAVLEHRGGVLLVLGAPGTGKSTLAVEHVRRRVLHDGVRPDSCLVLAPTRQSAARLRSAVSAGLGTTHADPLARTPSSLAFAVLRMCAADAGEPMPRLLSGAEQDVILRELLAGHEVDGTGPRWPAHVRPAIATAGFRAQLRDLLMRAVEHGLEPEDLRRLGERHDRPVWSAAADVLAEYDQVTALSAPGAYDPAWICTAAADRLEEDPALLAAVRARLSVLVVDDAQELTASAARLVSVLHAPGTDLVLLGDPDSSVLGFRGALPGRFLDLAGELHARQPLPVPEDRPQLPGLELDALAPAPSPRTQARSRGRTGAGPVPTVVLGVRHRGGPELAAVADRVAQRIGAVGSVRARRPEPATGTEHAAQDPPVRSGLARSQAQEAAFVAQWLRHAHLREGVAWSAMAVIARSGRQHELLRRALASGGVPVRVERSDVPLGQEPAVRPLLLAFDVVTRAPGEPWALAPEEVVALLTSPLCGVDPVHLRRLRRRVRAAELAAGGGRSAEELLVELVQDPTARSTPAGVLHPDEDVLAHLGRVLEAGREAVGGSAEQVLWALWEASGLAAVWARQALAGGALGMRADRDLDAVLVLFGAASSFVERLPGAGARAFLDHVRSAEVAADTLVSGARLGEAVEVLTPAAASGREWELVAVAGVQDGVWPDLRLRDTLLGAEALVAALRGAPVSGAEAVRAAQAQVRGDELRQFHVAVSRARRRLLVTAVASVDDQPSTLLDLVVAGAREQAPLEVPETLTLRGLVGRLRRTAVEAHRRGDLPERDSALDALLHLGEEGVGGTDPARWWDARDASTSAPLVPEGPVRVSPSRVQTFLDCPLRWLLTGRGAQSGGAARAEVGTLVHDVVAADPDADLPTLTAALDQRWSALGLDDSWVSRRQHEAAHVMLERYATYASTLPGEGRRVVGVELPLSVRVPAEEESDRDVLVAGAVDRLEVDQEGRAVVVDLKTGRTKPSRDQVLRHAQLGAYQVAVETGAFDAEVPGRQSGGAALVQLGADGGLVQSQPPVGADADPAWARRMVLTAGAGMAGGSFPARENPSCRTCDASFCCPLQPEGQQR